MNKQEKKNRQSLEDFFNSVDVEPTLDDFKVHDYIAVKCDKCGKEAGSTFVDMTGLKCYRHPMDVSGCKGIMRRV